MSSPQEIIQGSPGHFDQPKGESNGYNGQVHTTDNQNTLDGSTVTEEDVVMDEDEDEDLPMTLPISKIKRIFKMDPDYAGASQSAVYATGLATELFIQYFVEQASLIAKTEKRKKITYKDLSTAVSNHDTLNFLSDTVPKAQPIGELIQKKKVIVQEKSEERAEQKKPLSKGQQVLSFGVEKPEEKKVKLNDLVG